MNLHGSVPALSLLWEVQSMSPSLHRRTRGYIGLPGLGSPTDALLSPLSPVHSADRAAGRVSPR